MNSQYTFANNHGVTPLAFTKFDVGFDPGNPSQKVRKSIVETVKAIDDNNLEEGKDRKL